MGQRVGIKRLGCRRCASARRQLRGLGGTRPALSDQKQQPTQQTQKRPTQQAAAQLVAGCAFVVALDAGRAGGHALQCSMPMATCALFFTSSLVRMASSQSVMGWLRDGKAAEMISRCGPRGRLWRKAM